MTAPADPWTWDLDAPGIRTRILLRHGLLGGLPPGAAGDDPVGVADREALAHAQPLWRRIGGRPGRLVEVAGGEGSKSFDGARDLCGRLLRLGIDRETRIVAVGGGTVGDLAGFCASVLLRGIPLIQVPTTLTAMADGAIGGKTALDLPEGKNLVGTFHPAVQVWADPACLATLPAAAMRAGWAEVVKCAFLTGPVLWGALEAADPAAPPADTILAGAIGAKVARVAADPLDRGIRRELNLGHTLGHALEAATGWRLSHGEAVAIGLAFALRLSRARGILEEEGLEARGEALLSHFALPTRPPDRLDPDRVAGHLARDKKAGPGGAVRWVLPVRPGRVRIVDADPAVDLPCLRAFLSGR